MLNMNRRKSIFKWDLVQKKFFQDCDSFALQPLIGVYVMYTSKYHCLLIMQY